MPAISTVARWSLRVYICLVLLVVALGVGGLKISHSTLLGVRTGSMKPAFSTGDMLLVRPLGHSLHTGQVVSYKANDGRTISHRVFAIDNTRQQLTTRGDALDKSDTPIRQAAVSGRVVAVLPKLGSVINLIRTPLGLVLFIYLPALGIIAEEMARLTKHFGRGQYRALGFR